MQVEVHVGQAELSGDRALVDLLVDGRVSERMNSSRHVARWAGSSPSWLVVPSPSLAKAKSAIAPTRKPRRLGVSSDPAR